MTQEFGLWARCLFGVWGSVLRLRLFYGSSSTTLEQVRKPAEVEHLGCLLRRTIRCYIYVRTYMRMCLYIYIDYIYIRIHVLHHVYIYIENLHIQLRTPFKSRQDDHREAGSSTAAVETLCFMTELLYS